MAEEIFTRDPKDLGEKLWSLKNQGKFCDASLSVNGQQISVHANVLACYSQFFENTFENTKISSKEVTFTDVDADVMQSLIEYCYKGSLKIDEKNALDIFQMASILEMSTVLDNCAKILKKTLNSKNCLMIWKMANIGEDETLKTHILPFIKENIDKVYESSEFLSLDFSEMKQILSSKSKATTEKSLYEALKRWINHETGRKQYINELLNYVNLKCLPNNFLFSEAKLICDSDNECILRFFEASTLQNSNDLTNCSSSNTLVVVGSESLESSRIIEIYSLKSKKWISISYEKCAKNIFTTALINEKIILIGGVLNSASNTAEYYYLATGQTESLPQLKTARYESTAVNYADEAYVFGGYNGNLISTVEKWSPRTRTWQEVAPMTVSRTGLRAAVLDNEIFVIGGYNGQYLSLVEAYNPTTNTWKTCKEMNERRYFPGLAAMNGFLYAIGGINSSGHLKTAEKYDKSIDKWTMIQSLSIGKYKMAAGILNGQLVITGGCNNYGNVNSVEAYDEKNDEWIALSPMNQKRCHHCVLQVPWALARLALERKS